MKKNPLEIFTRIAWYAVIPTVLISITAFVLDITKHISIHPITSIFLLYVLVYVLWYALDRYYSTDTHSPLADLIVYMDSLCEDPQNDECHKTWIRRPSIVLGIIALVCLFSLFILIPNAG